MHATLEAQIAHALDRIDQLERKLDKQSALTAGLILKVDEQQQTQPARRGPGRPPKTERVAEGPGIDR